MNLIILILDLYIIAHVIWWILKATNQNFPVDSFLSKICEPFCRVFPDLKLAIGGSSITIAAAPLILTLVRFILSALH